MTDDRRGDGESLDGDGPVAGDGRVDPVTLEVVRNACEAVCEEMNATLVRTAYSPNVKERRDCSCALFDADGDLLSQAENMPVHLGAMPFSVAAALDRFPPESLEPGDAVVLNDPYRGGAHLPDVTLVTPIFAGGDEFDGDDPDAAPDGAEPEPVAYAANRAHHADVGGARAGSLAADSTEIYQEGLRLPPVKLYEGGEPNEGVFDVLIANVRTPDERRGDLRAQRSANATGARRFRDLVGRFGREGLAAATAEIADYSERRTRGELAALPDGTVRFEDVLDDDGRGNEGLPIRAAVSIDGDSARVDFEGTAAQTDGPVNAVFAVTASATYYAIRAVTDPEIPPNAGCYRPITIEAPEGSLVNPTPPAAVVGGNVETSQRITDVVLGALAKLAPERAAAAGQGTMNNLTVGGADRRGNAGSEGDGTEESAGGRPFTFYETQAGGFGGRAGADGMDAVHVHMSNTLNTPAEVLETAYPLRIRRYELRPDSGGPGEFRGGLGLRRDVEIRADGATVSLLADRHRSAPYGLEGGRAGATGAAYLFESAADAERGDDTGGERLPPKCVFEADRGAVVSLRTPGGGGYGDPDDRDREAVERDLRLGKLSARVARERYGVDPAALATERPDEPSSGDEPGDSSG